MAAAGVWLATVNVAHEVRDDGAAASRDRRSEGVAPVGEGGRVERVRATAAPGAGVVERRRSRHGRSPVEHVAHATGLRVPVDEDVPVAGQGRAAQQNRVGAVGAGAHDDPGRCRRRERSRHDRHDCGDQDRSREHARANVPSCAVGPGEHELRFSGASDIVNNRGTCEARAFTLGATARAGISESPAPRGQDARPEAPAGAPRAERARRTGPPRRSWRRAGEPRRAVQTRPCGRARCDRRPSADR